MNEQLKHKTTGDITEIFYEFGRRIEIVGLVVLDCDPLTGDYGYRGYVKDGGAFQRITDQAWHERRIPIAMVKERFPKERPHIWDMQQFSDPSAPHRKPNPLLQKESV